VRRIDLRTPNNGYTVTVGNTVAVPMLELEDGWKGLDRKTTRCKNVRFAVANFGGTDRPSAGLPPAIAAGTGSARTHSWFLSRDTESN
jgi:hypothetical protein